MIRCPGHASVMSKFKAPAIFTDEEIDHPFCSIGPKFWKFNVGSCSGIIVIEDGRPVNHYRNVLIGLDSFEIALFSHWLESHNSAQT